MRQSMSLLDSWLPSQDWYALTPATRRWLDDSEALAPRAFVPACEVEEKKDHFLITVDLPGVSKQDINIDVHEGRLVVRAERKPVGKSDATRHFSERRYGLFERVFDLGDKVDTESVDAAYRDGVLQIALAKTPETQPKSVEIRSEAKGGLFDRLIGGAS